MHSIYYLPSVTRQKLRVLFGITLDIDVRAVEEHYRAGVRLRKAPTANTLISPGIEPAARTINIKA